MTERWIDQKGEHGESPDIDHFLEDIRAVCLQHKLSISHEDGHGSFLIRKYNETCMDWLKGADDVRTEEEIS